MENGGVSPSFFYDPEKMGSFVHELIVIITIQYGLLITNFDENIEWINGVGTSKNPV